jgi:phosphoadenylyl-sulfate reductase (thioredoxin)
MIDKNLIAELEKVTEPGALLSELARRFPGRVGIGQPTDTAIIALAVKSGAKVRIYTADTQRLFPETYDYFRTLEKHFGITIERAQPPEIELRKMIEENGEYLFFNSKDKQEYCCFVRKVLPNQKILDGLDVWVTGLRRDQSASRGDLPRLEIIDHKSGGDPVRPILKVNPLIGWTAQQVADYLTKFQIPNHPLFDKTLPGGYFYESLGCVICTTPISPYEPRRAGRWRWFNAQDSNKECGIHLPTPDQKP